jgi:hypothetical protein
MPANTKKDLPNPVVTRLLLDGSVPEEEGAHGGLAGPNRRTYGRGRLEPEASIWGDRT